MEAKNIESDGVVAIDGGLNLPEFCRVQIKFLNAGSTHAILTFQCVEQYVGFSIADVPNYKNFSSFPPDIILKYDELAKSICARNFRLSDDDRKEIREGRSNLWIYGIVGYDDYLGESHEKKFCIRWLGLNPNGSPATFIRDVMTPEEYLNSY